LEKISKIIKYSVPKKVWEPRSFFKLTGYWGNFCKITQILRNL